MRYLARRYGTAPFAPGNEAGWAAADKWMDWASLSFAAPFRDLFWNLVRATPETRDMAAVERGRIECARLMTMADQALGQAPWLSGEAFGIGDIPLGCLAYAWFGLPIERPSLPRLEDWYARLSARPAYRKGVMTGLS